MIERLGWKIEPIREMNNENGQVRMESEKRITRKTWRDPQNRSHKLGPGDRCLTEVVEDFLMSKPDKQFVHMLDNDALMEKDIHKNQGNDGWFENKYLSIKGSEPESASCTCIGVCPFRGLNEHKVGEITKSLTSAIHLQLEPVLWKRPTFSEVAETCSLQNPF